MTTQSPTESDLKAKANELLPQFKEKLASDAATEAIAGSVSDDTLLKFVMWKPSLDRAWTRFQDHIKWRNENPFAFDKTPLKASQDETLKRVLESEVLVLPPETVTAKDGSTLLFGRLRNNDMTDGRTPEDVVRMVLYNMDRALEREATQCHGITIFHDMKDVSRNNIHTSIPSILFRAIIGHFPLKITAVYILNAPFFARALFKVISLGFPAKVKSRIRFVSELDDILQAIDQENLLEEHGGNIKPNQREWVAQQMKREQDGSLQSLEEIIQQQE